MKQSKAETPASRWTFLSNHAHVMICIRRQPDARMRDIALKVGITERSVQLIVAELVKEKYLAIEKVGRSNRYKVLDVQPLRHPLESHHTLKQLLDAVK